MKPSILFWFYKDFEICLKRLRLLRKLNPDTSIFGLFGGPSAETKNARKKLGRYLNDFYEFPEERDAQWKWLNGDLLISQWFKDRGRMLEWETIFIVQWDLLILESVERLFCNLLPGQILLSGLRPLSEVVAWWDWVKTSDKKKQRAFADFQERLSTQFNYHDDLWACLFIIACLPRKFLIRYAEIAAPDSGFMEYKIPTLARAFGIPFCLNHNFVVWWRDDPATQTNGGQYVLNAVGREIPTSQVFHEMSLPNGYRVFHPFHKAIPEWMFRPPIAAITYFILRIQEVCARLIRRIVSKVKRKMCC